MKCQVDVKDLLSCHPFIPAGKCAPGKTTTFIYKTSTK